jgi:DNA-binding NarL/FixJ family response regulator
MASPIRVLVADDDLLTRQALTSLLASEPDIDVVGEAADGKQALQAVLTVAPDIVLMDFKMPVMDGIEATRRIVMGQGGISPDVVQIVMLSTYHTDDDIREALLAGASGYVLKDAADSLPVAIRAVAEGGAYLHPTVARQLLGRFARHPDIEPPDRQDLERLTRREREVLTLIAYGFTNAQLVGHLVIAETTAKTHVNRLIMKLGVVNRAQLVTFAFQTGLVQPGTSPPGPPQRNVRGL